MDDPDPVVGIADSAQTHPWRRYFARYLDGVLATMGIGIVLALAFPSWIDQPDLIFFAPILVGWAMLEALLLSFAGTTPARWLFGIRVMSAETDRPLPPARSLKRVAIVWVAGLGLAIPLVTLATQGFAYHRLRTTGTTIWDRSCNATVTHAKWGAARSLVCTACTVLVLGALVMLAIYAPE